jgi:hypothetical protein
MRFVALALLLSAATASAQDTSFSRLHLRVQAMRLPVTGHIADDWKAGTGARLEAGSNVGRGELALGLGHVSFDPTTGKPPFSMTFFSLAWTALAFQSPRVGLDAGARLSDVFMDIDDPAQVIGLRHEEDVMISVVGRGRVVIGRGFSAFAEGTYGSFMLSTRTPIASIGVGLGRDMTMPQWLSHVLR